MNILKCMLFGREALQVSFHANEKGRHPQLDAGLCWFTAVACYSDCACASEPDVLRVRAAWQARGCLS